MLAKVINNLLEIGVTMTKEEITAFNIRQKLKTTIKEGKLSIENIVCNSCNKYIFRRCHLAVLLRTRLKESNNKNNNAIIKI